MVFLTAFSGKAIASAAFIPKAVFGAMFVVTIGDFTISHQKSIACPDMHEIGGFQAKYLREG